MPNPLVSIVIPTWQRPELLIETIGHIKKQFYPNIEIIVVVDGQDEELIDKIFTKYFVQYEDYNRHEDQYDIRLIELGRNWSSMGTNNFGIAPLLVGYLTATGKYVMSWCDDERALTDDHISLLVNLIEETNVDFVYPRVQIWRVGFPDGPETQVIGTVPPRHGQITHYLFKPNNFINFGFPDFGSHPVDWALIEKWIRNGARYKMLNEVTFNHRLDQ